VGEREKGERKKEDGSKKKERAVCETLNNQPVCVIRPSSFVASFV
jgi:hypothetical protein